jgi:hypothetical protein
MEMYRYTMIKKWERSGNIDNETKGRVPDSHGH